MQVQLGDAVDGGPQHGGGTGRLDTRVPALGLCGLGLYEDICIVSNDSDPQAPVGMAMKLGRAVITVNPHVHKRQRDSLVGWDVRRLSLGRLGRNLLPDQVSDPSTGRPVSCPPSWRPCGPWLPKEAGG